MSDEPEETAEEEDDTEFYVPSPTILADGDVLMLDPAELCELFNGLAITNKGCDLFVLSRETLKWVKVEAVPAPRKIKSVP